MKHLESKKQYPITHRAGWLVMDPFTIIEDGYIKIDSGKIKEVGKWSALKEDKYIDHGSGALIPALVNVHTHLELCALKGKLNCQNGFLEWVKNLLQNRDAISRSDLINGAEKGIKEITRTGCAVVGEISSLDMTKDLFFSSPLSGVWFKEYLGNNSEVDVQEFIKKDQKRTSLCGHAPHSTSPGLLSKIKKETRKNKLPFSIHLSETEDEIRFIRNANGKWANFLSRRGVDYSDWGLPSKSPVQYIEKMGLLDHRTIAVHMIHADQKDFHLLEKNNVSVCICLRSNLNLHTKLPDVEKMMQLDLNLCLGTDSLASTDDLNLFNEMVTVRELYPFISPEEILAMATLNGAKALGVDNMFGTLAPGKDAVFLYLPVDASKRRSLIEKISYGDFDDPLNLIKQEY